MKTKTGRMKSAIKPPQTMPRYNPNKATLEAIDEKLGRIADALERIAAQTAQPSYPMYPSYPLVPTDPVTLPYTPWIAPLGTGTPLTPPYTITCGPNVTSGVVRVTETDMSAAIDAGRASYTVH